MVLRNLLVVFYLERTATMFTVSVDSGRVNNMTVGML